MAFFLVVAEYTFFMNIIINLSDIFYLTGVRSHDRGEIMILLEKKTKTKEKKDGIIFCDARTS
jgi:hypothetical protein